MKWQKNQIRKLYVLLCIFLLTTCVISGCGTIQPSEKEEKEFEQELDDTVSLEDINYYGDFYLECKAIEGQNMYCFTNEAIPDFEFLVGEEQTIGTVIYGSESITFPLGARIFEEEKGYGDIYHMDLTGDGVDEFIYTSFIYDKVETWKNSDASVWRSDTTIVDLKNMKMIEEDDVLNYDEIPEQIPVTIVDCVSEEDGSYRYVFRKQGGNEYGYVDTLEPHEIGEETVMEITSVYVGNPTNSMYGVVIGYGFPNEYLEECIVISIPYYYDTVSGKMKLAIGEATSTLTTGSYIYEAMMKEGMVVELPEEETEDQVFYGTEGTELGAINYLFYRECDITASGQRDLYYVNYPDSRDKSAVYLITLGDEKGYLYAFLEGNAFQNEMEEWEYFWHVKEIVYVSEVPESLK